LAVSAHGYGFIIALNGVAKFDTKGASILAPVFIPKSPYCIAVDDLTENIYLGDAKDYVQNGTLYSYNKNGLIEDSAAVGIIPGTIVFKH